MKRLTCTCGATTKAAKNSNCTCKCGKEYYYSKPLGKWLFTHRVHSVKEG